MPPYLRHNSSHRSGLRDWYVPQRLRPTKLLPSAIRFARMCAMRPGNWFPMHAVSCSPHSIDTPTRGTWRGKRFQLVCFCHSSGLTSNMAVRCTSLPIQAGMWRKLLRNGRNQAYLSKSGSFRYSRTGISTRLSQSYQYGSIGRYPCSEEVSIHR
jgi:hypothetical protein